jgi:hypothetical protein
MPAHAFDIISAIWTSVWEFLRSNRETLVALAALVSAIAAVVAARASTRNARMQLGESWLDALRDDLSEIFAIASGFDMLRPGTLSAEEEFKNRQEKRSRLWFLNHRVRLRLDNLEADRSKALIAAMTHLFFESHKDLEFDQAVRRAETIAREILTAERKRMRAGR